MRRSECATMERKRRTDILKEFYKKGMTGKKSELIKKAAKAAKCSEKSVLTFIYNQNKVKSCKPDVKSVHVPSTVGKYQSFQRKYARACKTYGMKYSNEGVVTMWKSGEGKLIGSKSLKEKKMRGRTFMSKQEFKVEELVMKISQVNALSYYARVTPCGQSLVCSISILSEKNHQSLKDIADYLNSVRCVLQKITSEDECFIGCVLTGSVKINKMVLNDLQLDNQELKIIKDLLGFEIFNRKVSRKLELWIQKCLK